MTEATIDQNSTEPAWYMELRAFVNPLSSPKDNIPLYLVGAFLARCALWYSQKRKEFVRPEERVKAEGIRQSLADLRAIAPQTLATHLGELVATITADEAKKNPAIEERLDQCYTQVEEKYQKQ